MSGSWWTTPVHPDKMIRWQRRVRAILPFLCAASVILALVDGRTPQAVFYVVLGIVAVWQWSSGRRLPDRADGMSVARRYLPNLVALGLILVVGVVLGVYSILDGRKALGLVVIGLSLSMGIIFARSIGRWRRASQRSPSNEPPAP